MPPEQLQYPRLLFRETQRFRQLWVWILCAAIAMVPVILITPLLLQGPRATQFITLSIFMAVGFFPLAITFIGLTTIVTSDMVILEFFPFRKRRIPIAHIASCSVEKYHPIKEFGGWGIKWSLRNTTTAYSVSGDQGLRLQLAGGEKLLIGTLRPRDLAEALRQAGAPLPPEG